MPDNDLLRLSAQIVSAHIGHNSVHADELPTFIRSVYEALEQVGTPTPAAEPLRPAVPIKKSVFPSYIVCLEDEPWSNGQAEGQINRLKTLKRAMYGRAGVELLRARMLPLQQPTSHTV
jgi:predicted transcriptional regulator